MLNFCKLCALTNIKAARIDMNFNEHKIELINKVVKTPEFKKDIALQRVVEFLKPIDSIKMLKKEKGLINRICVDSVENWDTIELILSFTSNYTK